MPIIDLFNKTADADKITTAIVDGSFRFRSKLYAKYLAKSAAEGIILGVVGGLALVGAAVVIADALSPSIEEDAE